MNLEQIKTDISEGKSKTIYYSSGTLWWTHLEDDVKEATEKGKKATSKKIDDQLKQDIPAGQKKILLSSQRAIIDSTVPVDPFGAPLMQVADPNKWISESEKGHKFFGKHGLSAFIMCHHSNIGENMFQKWDAVNQFIDNIDVNESKNEEE